MTCLRKAKKKRKRRKRQKPVRGVLRLLYQTSPRLKVRSASPGGFLSSFDRPGLCSMYVEPLKESTPPPTAVAASAADQPAAYEGWTAVWDATNQAYYYFNASTGETTWEVPAAASATAPPTAMAIGDTGAPR
jgi:hypothetical protein